MRRDCRTTGSATRTSCEEEGQTCVSTTQVCCRLRFGVMHAMENGGGRTMASNGGGAAEDPTSTKARLNGILESFHAFDSDMKTGTRVRRENDEHRIAQLTAELTRLEKTLNQEIKRRIEMNKSVQVVRKRAAAVPWRSACFLVEVAR